MATSAWSHICFNASGVPTASASGTATANLPAFSANAPILCLADVQNSTGSVNTIGKIYDVRTFTTTQKTYVTNQTTLAGLGEIVSVATATPVANGVTQVPATLNTAHLRGVVVAQSSATSTTAVTTIIATSGSQWVKYIAAAGTLNAALGPQTTTGVAGFAGINSTATGTMAIYSVLGQQLKLSDNATCNASTNCQMSVPTDIRIR
jgi:hypothetical protein